MRAIVFFVQLLLWLMIIRIVLRGLVRMFGGGGQQRGGSARPRPAPGPAAAPPRQIEDLVLDRICQSYFPRSRAVAARIAGREELFCSTSCRDKALAAVARAS